MSNELFLEGNYIVAVKNTVRSEYSAESEYTERTGAFVIKSPLGGELTIPIDTVAEWDDAKTGGKPHTVTSIRALFTNNSGGFNLTEDHLLMVGQGKFPKQSIVVISGRNADVDTAIVDLGMEDTIFDWPTTGSTLEAISDSAADDAGGLGTRIITVNGLETGTFNLISEDIIMNGLVATLTTTLSFIRVNSVVAKENGTYASTGEGSNDGNITIRRSGGGTTQSFISSDIGGSGKSQDFKYTIPANHIAIVLGVGFNVSSSKIGKLIFNIRTGADVVLAPFTSRLLTSIIDGESGRHDIPREELGTTLPEKTDVWASAIATAVNTEVSARAAFLLIDLS